MALPSFSKKQFPSTPYDLNCELHPYRITAGRTDSIDIDITLTNLFDKELLTSIVIELPKGLGFDQTALSQEREIRLGMLQPSETKHFTARIWGSQRTTKGEYKIDVCALSHYRDYGYVLNEVRKSPTLRAV